MVDSRSLDAMCALLDSSRVVVERMPWSSFASEASGLSEVQVAGVLRTLCPFAACAGYGAQLVGQAVAGEPATTALTETGPPDWLGARAMADVVEAVAVSTGEEIPSEPPLGYMAVGVGVAWLDSFAQRAGEVDWAGAGAIMPTLATDQVAAVAGHVLPAVQLAVAVLMPVAWELAEWRFEDHDPLAEPLAELERMAERLRELVSPRQPAAAR